MKTDKSKKNIVIASISRKIMNPEEWLYSKVYFVGTSLEFDLEENELSIFEVKSASATTIITTRRILERNNDEINFVRFEDIDNMVYGHFKGQINKPQLSIFRIIDIYGEEHNFQMETGKASIGLINAVNTILRLIKHI
jgi:hypothetical protein